MALAYIVIGNVYIQEGQVVLVLRGNLGIQQSPIMQKKTQLRCEQLHMSFHGTSIIYNNLIILRKSVMRIVTKWPKVKSAERSRICFHENRIKTPFKRRCTSKNSAPLCVYWMCIRILSLLYLLLDFCVNKHLGMLTEHDRQRHVLRQPELTTHRTAESSEEHMDFNKYSV